MTKIVITGTHSTGKTTLAKKISEELKIPFIRGDKAIEICSAHFPGQSINMLSVENAWKLQNLMFDSFDDALNSVGDCVTDGFHLTCLPYGMAYTFGDITKMDGYSDFVQKVLDRSKQFDKIFYLPPEIPLEKDLFRPSDLDLRLNIDNYLFTLLQEFNYRTLSGSLNSRFDVVSRDLSLNSVFSNYIAFEGLPRSGKTTQINLLKNYANSINKSIYICERNKNIYMDEFKRRKNINIYDSSLEMLKLHSDAIKYDYNYNNVEERLSEGQIVIADRQKFTTMSLFSSLGVPRHLLYEKVYDLPDPGQIIYLDTNPYLSVMRSIQTEPNNLLKQDLSFQKKIREAYLFYLKDHKFNLIPSNISIKKTSDLINKLIF